MTNGLISYLETKDSGVEWLGEVPTHWEVRRLRNVSELRVSNVNKHTKEGELPIRLCNYVDVYKNDHIRSGMAFMAATAKSDEVDRFQLVTGDVLITKDSESWNDIGVPALVQEVDADVVCGYHLALLRPDTMQLKGTFLFRAMQNRGVAHQFHVEAKGVTRYGLSHDAIKSVQIPVPSLPEQTAIVRFLDYADRRIQRYIRAKEKLIELLKEQKQAVIHQAVTGQIDISTGQPYPTYKDSGVEWQPKVPTHWERTRLRVLLQPVDRRSTTGDETLLSLRRDHGIVIYAEHFSRPPQSESLVGYKLVETGQLVVNRLQANNGLVFCSTLDGLVSPDYSVFDRKIPLQMRFLSEALRTSPVRAYFRRNATGLGTGTAGFLRLYDDKFLATPIPIPPVPEQDLIIEYIDRANANTGAAISRAHRQIELIRECRTRLIADVVTGKLDVREAANALPEIDPVAVANGVRDLPGQGGLPVFDHEDRPAEVAG